jgi:hypothetical protein
MKCPNCKQDVPDNCEDPVCPFCGKARKGASRILAVLGKILAGIALGALIVCGVALLVLAVLFVGCLVVTSGRF